MNYEDLMFADDDVYVEFNDIIDELAYEVTTKIIGYNPGGYVVDAKFNNLYYPIKGILYNNDDGKNVERIISESAVEIARLVYGSKRRAKAIEAMLRDSVNWLMN